MAALPVSVVALVTRNVSGRYPLLTGPSREVVVRVHNVDILERQTLGLEKEEVDDGCCGKVAAEEDETKGVSDTVIGIRREETNQEVTWGGLLVNAKCARTKGTYQAS